MGRFALVLCIAFTVGSLIQSCNDRGVDPLPPSENGTTVDTVSFQTDVYPIFSAAQYACNSCHSGTGDLAWYAGTASQTRNNLVNVEATRACAPDKRVVPGNAGQSVLYRRLEGFTCGDRMPQGGNPIAGSDLTLIRDWINQGALSN